MGQRPSEGMLDKTPLVIHIMIGPEARILEVSMMYALSGLTWGEEVRELANPTTLFMLTRGHGSSHNHGIKNPLREDHTSGISSIEASST